MISWASVDLPEPEMPHVRRTVLLLVDVLVSRMDWMDSGRRVEVAAIVQ